jgi:plasmid stabilization system protein ParE
MLEIVWKGGAEEDLLRIFADLEEFGEGAGAHFVALLDGTLHHLRNYPQMAPVFEHPMRRLVVGNSGFGLFYTVEDRGVIVHALIHLSQSPGSIRSRVLRMLGLR